MIRYQLTCENAHGFESWFPSSGSYDAQVARGLVACPVCDSAKVEKRIMAPAVARRDRASAPRPEAAPTSTPEPAPPAPEPQAVALLSERERHLRAMLRAVREHVVQNAEHVGPRFAEEARKMHYGELDHRSIYGEASPEEARALLDEGIEVHPLPLVPEDRN